MVPFCFIAFVASPSLSCMAIVLSWLLIHKINVISFGWTMPVIVASEPIAFLFVVVAAVVLAAFILASLRQQAEVNKALKNLAGE